MTEKYPRMKPGAPNPFLDREGYKKFVADKEAEFRKALESQRAAVH
jgi:metallo-beta-lactamase class B